MEVEQISAQAQAQTWQSETLAVKSMLHCDWTFPGAQIRQGCYKEKPLPCTPKGSRCGGEGAWGQGGAEWEQSGVC